ncbi:hypothetical protein WJX79_005454 [Trebouxia sp. C0005]
MVKIGTNQLSVAVIGAGAAGLVATRELLCEGHHVTAFEQNDNVGGIWDYQEECETEDLLGRNPNRRHVHSSMYSSLRTNLPRQIMSFSDFPFIPEVMGDRSHDSRRFPSHTEVQAWLEVFAAKFHLRPHIKFNMVVCVGNYHQPNLPEIKGMDDFKGLQMHAHNYRSSSMFAGMQVIVVGASFSGEELARAIADVASHVFHSARSFQESTPRDNITRVAMLTELSSDGVALFQDGTQIANIDAVIYCTGYQYAYPFLEGTGLVTSHDMRVDPLWQHIFPPNVAPTLAFVGLIWKSLRNPQFELQSKLVARVLSGRAQLPSRLQMVQEVADFYQQLVDCGVPVRYTHNQTNIMPVNQWSYNAKLAEICGPDVPKQPDWLQALYAATSVHIVGRPDSFRDEWGPQEIAVYDIADKFCTQMMQELRDHNA